MDKMIIVYKPDGSMEHTLKDSFFRPGDKITNRTIDRMSEVLPSYDGKDFCIKFIKGCFGQFFFSKEHNEFLLASKVRDKWIRRMGHQKGHCRDKFGDTIFLDTYEEAVEVEIAVFDMFRFLGIEI